LLELGSDITASTVVPVPIKFFGRVTSMVKISLLVDPIFEKSSTIGMVRT
jgi:hypothetical protein